MRRSPATAVCSPWSRPAASSRACRMPPTAWANRPAAETPPGSGAPSSPALLPGCLVTPRTLHLRADEPRPTLLRQHPRPLLERRLVAHVLRVPAREVGDPRAGFIQVRAKAEDVSSHAPSVIEAER